jgi:hypothetical protein
MIKFVLLILVFVFAYAGMAWLALSLKSHWRQLNGVMALSRWRVITYRVLGGCALVCGLALCLWVDHPTIAVLVWIMSIAVAAKAVALTLSYRAKYLRFLAFVRPFYNH